MVTTQNRRRMPDVCCRVYAETRIVYNSKPAEILDIVHRITRHVADARICHRNHT